MGNNGLIVSFREVAYMTSDPFKCFLLVTLQVLCTVFLILFRWYTTSVVERVNYRVCFHGY